MSSSKIITSEVVALPGIKGDKGEAFTYDDFTPEQIAELQRPATEAAKVAIASAQRAEAAAESVQGAVEDAEQASQSAQQAATEAQEAVKNAKAVIDKAETAINNANTAAEKANTAVESVNALEERVEQAEATRVQSETQRQTAETNRASSEQRREANETQRQEKFAQIESDATALKNSLNEAEAQRVSAENARKEAETQRETSEQNRETEFSEIKNEAETLVTQTTEAKNAATEAATSATNAAGAANTAAESANEAAETANQAAQNVDGRVTALESKASQVYENLAAIESSGESNPNKIYIDGETLIPYVYKDGEFVPFKGEKDTLSYKYYKLDYSGINNINTLSKFEHIAYDEETDTIYLLAIHPVNLLLKVKDMKIVLSKPYSMVYERSDSPIVVIGDKIYATMNNDYNSSFIRRINKDTLEQELAIQYDGIISGNLRCGLYRVSENLYLRGLDNKLYLVNKDDLTLEETGIENIKSICNFRLDKIAYTDGVNCYLFDGAITHTKSLPDGFNDVYFIAPYRAHNSDHQLLLVLVKNGKARMFSFGDEDTFGEITMLSSNGTKMFPFMRIRNISSTSSPCIIQDTNMYYCNSFFPGFYGTPVCYGAPFNVNNAYLYGNKDIYCSNGGIIM